MRLMLAALLPGLFNEFYEPVALLAAHAFLSCDQVRGEGVFQGAAEESLEHALKRAAPGFVFCDARKIDDFASFLAAFEMPLFLEDVHHAPDGHGRGCIR